MPFDGIFDVVRFSSEDLESKGPFDTSQPPFVVVDTKHGDLAVQGGLGYKSDVEKVARGGRRDHVNEIIFSKRNVVVGIASALSLVSAAVCFGVTVLAWSGISLVSLVQAFFLSSFR